jgi:hypothetical protein
MGWLQTFSICFTAVLPSDERDDYLACVRERIKAQLCDSNDRWTAD